ncbi:MAG: crotonobetainyl-CoA--carnitine CoA-transferase [Bacteriovoracaceae bacterium]
MTTINKEFGVHFNGSQTEQSNRQMFYEHYKNSPIPPQEKLSNLFLYTKRQDVSSFLFINHMYQQIVNTHGVIMEFGVRWGKNLSILSSLRGIYEPFNHNRKIIGFDTFSGFPSVDAKDGSDELIKKGSYSVSENYEQYLSKVLDYHETESPISHIKKYELRKGDASKEIIKYLEENPQTIIAMAYFDFDIYAPTKDCLMAISKHLTKGAIIGFDELNYDKFPGETLALNEVLGLGNYQVRRTPFSGMQSYIVYDGKK